MKARLAAWLINLLCVSLALLWLFPGARFRLMQYVSQETFHEDRPTSYWLRAVADGTDSQREHAATVLGKIVKDAPETVPLLTTALIDPDYVVRTNAAKALG